MFNKIKKNGENSKLKLFSILKKIILKNPGYIPKI